MEKTFVDELREGQVIHSVFLVGRHEMRTTRTGEPFLRLSLEDRTGWVEGVAFQDADALASRIRRDDFAAIRGEVVRRNDALSIEISDLDRVEDGAVDAADFFASSRWDPDVMLGQLKQLVEDHVASEAIRAFLDALLGDEELTRPFRAAPAAMSNHHAYRGGLLEHTLSMARMALRTGEHYDAYYPGLLNTDLLVAGVLLHDFAKIWELSYRRTFDYTTPGRLVGHIPMGAKLVGRVAARARRPISEDLQMHLEHLVLSHHGEREYGAAQKPKTAEAMVLHQIDMLDSRMNMLWNEMQATKVPDATESWSEFRRSLGDRILFRGRNSGDWDVASPTRLEDLDGPGLRKSRAGQPPLPTTLNLFEEDE